MTIRLLLDIEEAISREIRRISFFDNRSVSHTVLQDTFDPFTGEVVQLNIEPDFYDSSADTKMIQYPHFFVKLLKILEDKDSGRLTPPYGNTCETPVTSTPKAYEVVLYQSDGIISAPGNLITTSSIKIRKVQEDFYLRILSGNNKGTYIVETVTPMSAGNHEIVVSNTLLNNLPAINFNITTRVVTFVESVDLNTIKVADQFKDFSTVLWNITAIDINTNSITIDGIGIPDLSNLGSIERVGDVFQNADPSVVVFTVMNPANPIINTSGNQVFTDYETANPAIPLNIFYLIRIDSKERATHIDIANRIWEEFNPPRTGLPTIVRTRLSAEQLLTADITTGGSSTITISDNTKYNINDIVSIFNDFTPTKDINGQGFESLLTAKVIGKTGTTQLLLDTIIPDTFKVDNHTKIVSNADYSIYEFHFEDHVTRDVEGAQYWSHELTFLVQAWMDRQGEPLHYEGIIQSIGMSNEDFNGNVIIDC